MNPTIALLDSAQLIRQGAEAKVYKGFLHPVGSNDTREAVLLKYRFKKQYRHPTLNASLTRQRVAGEARSLMKCLRAGVKVPGLRMVDAADGVIGIEWIEGESVRVLLGGLDEEESTELEDVVEGDEDSPQEEPLSDYGVSADDVMRLVGAEISKMHAADVIHGDLTTSNMMLRRKSSSSTELVLIDFGLSFVSTLAEDKAVDLYVLERAFASTHPDSEPLFQSVLDAYAETNLTDWKAVKRKLDDVRLRGRKRSMVG